MADFPFWNTIKTRILALVLLTLCSACVIFLAASYFLSQSLSEERSEQSRRLVEVAHSVVKAVAEDGKRKGYSTEESQKLAISYLQQMHYDQNDYFWVNNYDGLLLLHPSASIEGHNVIDLKDGIGNFVIQNFIAIAREKGEGWTTYYWPPDATAKKKTSYVKAFPEWQWVIGSGVYTETVDKQINKFTSRIAVSAVILAMLIFALAYNVGQSITQPILSLQRTMNKMAEGDYSHKIHELNRGDELGAMAQTVRVFQENAKTMALLESEQKNTESMQTEFVSVVSHELRTPLTSIRGSLGLMVNGAAGALPEKAQKLLSIAYDNCQRLNVLINDILDIEKISSGDMQFEKKRENLNQLLKTAADTNKYYAEKYYVRYEYLQTEQNIDIYVDSIRFQQIMSNFLSNAAKYSPGGAKVDIIAKPRDGIVRIMVRDYGLGISEEFRTRIFRKFSQADSTSTRQKGGTGLGLYISKQLVENMGGQIGYESTKGLGSTFWVEFAIMAPPSESPDNTIA